MTDERSVENHPRRRTKADRKEFITQLIGNGPEVDIWKNIEGDGAISDGIISAMTLEEKFVELGNRIAARVNKAEEQAFGNSRLEASTWTPWVNRDSPTERIQELRRRLFLNERIIGALAEHLAVHEVLSMKIRELISQTIDAAREKEGKLGKVIEDLAVEMEKKGLLASAVQQLPKREIEGIVTYINHRKSPEGKAALEALIAGKEKPDLAAEFAIFDRNNEGPRLKIEEVDVPVDDAIIVPVKVNFEPSWSPENGDVPPEFWSQFQELTPNYRWEYSEASTPDEIEIASMPLPPADTYENLHKFRDETRKFPPIPVTDAAVRMICEAYLKAEYGLVAGEVPVNTVKAWMFMIHGRRLDPVECDKFYKAGFFDGVTMPCPATGPAVIRTLRQI
jgi:hypothetical protein